MPRLALIALLLALLPAGAAGAAPVSPAGPVRLTPAGSIVSFFLLYFCIIFTSYS